MDNDLPELNAVTGAFAYTGKHIAQQLLLAGKRVKTLTRRAANANPFGHRVIVVPLNFSDPGVLAESLREVATLYNTYWVRFSYGHITFEDAIANSEILIRAAEASGVRRIVHISVTNANPWSPLPYFRAKAFVEELVRNSRLSYAIVRPTLIFGPEDILLNNIAWLLRRFPVFAIAGSGDYRLQPVFVEDVANLAVSAGCETKNMVIDAAGPETYRFEELVRLVAENVRSKARIIHVSPALVVFISRLLGYALNDILLTRDELDGLMRDLLVCSGFPTGRVRLSEWLKHNAGALGASYVSELDRHYRLRPR